jgi:hypothetical protein
MITYNPRQAERSDPASGEAGAIEKLEKRVSHLWESQGGKSDLDQAAVMKNRAAEVLREVDKRGWDKYRSICEDAVKAANQIWRECEALVSAAAEVDGMGEQTLLHGCKQLLGGCDLLITSEEEIIDLMDTGTKHYRDAHQKGELCWQQHFSSG